MITEEKVDEMALAIQDMSRALDTLRCVYKDKPLEELEWVRKELQKIDKEIVYLDTDIIGVILERKGILGYKKETR